jgi:hypothetical protein
MSILRAGMPQSLAGIFMSPIEKCCAAKAKVSYFEGIIVVADSINRGHG